MGVTHPITVAATGTRLTADNVVPFVTNQAYALFSTSDERKLVLGNVAQAVLQGFLDETGPALPRLHALLRAFDDGHVKAWSTDASIEDGLAMTTVGGAFDPSGTDAVSVVTNSASGTKLDYYQRRTVTYDVRLEATETARATLRVDLFNDSPTSGYPAYVIGPFRTYSTEPGQNLAVVNLYCDVGCVLQHERQVTGGVTGRPVTGSPSSVTSGAPPAAPWSSAATSRKAARSSRTTSERIPETPRRCRPTSCSRRRGMGMRPAGRTG